MRRRAALLLPLLAAACRGDDPPPARVGAAPPRYDYLTPLRLNVASVDVGDAPQGGPLDVLNPLPPGQALRRMAQDRISAGGAAGRAAFVVDAAEIRDAGGRLSGVMAVHLDVLGPDGARAGFAEARVTRTAALPRPAALPAALQAMTRAMMDDMNVEFEFQVRRALKDQLQGVETAPAPAAVQQQDLSAPGKPLPINPASGNPAPAVPAAGGPGPAPASPPARDTAAPES